MSEKMTVLFVDDEERILRSLKMLFRGRYHVLTTTDGNEALKLLEQTRVHAVVSDQRMPKMTGVDLLRQVREVSPNTMRILLTGYSELDAMIGSVNEGEIFRFISKPWNADEIVEVVAKAVAIAASLFEFTGDIENLKQNAADAKREGSPVLLLDTDEAVYHTVTETLHGLPEPYALYWARSLDEAFDLLATHEIKIVLSDVFIDGTSIAGAIKTLKQEYPEIVALILTSFKDTRLVEHLINQGQIFRFLPKPVGRGLLARSITAAVSHQRLLERSPVQTTRHKVEPIDNQDERQLADRIRGFFSRFRRRQAQPDLETSG
jgi:serine/threonine-protein kinase